MGNQTFGQVIATARKEAGLSQKELAEMIKKEDGTAISPQYLNDIEHNRRNPPSEPLLDQLAQVLKVPEEILYFYAQRLPTDLAQMKPKDEQVVQAYKAFRKALKGKQG